MTPLTQKGTGYDAGIHPITQRGRVTPINAYNCCLLPLTLGLKGISPRWLARDFLSTDTGITGEEEYEFQDSLGYMVRPSQLHYIYKCITNH